MIDIVDYIKTKAEAHNWIPIVANASSVQYELNKSDLTTAQNFLYITLPKIRRGKTGQYYDGDLFFSLEIMLGRKFDPNKSTVSSVAETTEQKYNNRLFELENELNDFISEILQCARDLEEFQAAELTPVMNMFSANVDAVTANIDVRAWNQ